MGMGVVVLSPMELVRLCDRATPGMRRDFVGEWVVRSSLGTTGRANSTMAFDELKGSAADAVAAAEAWHGERDQPLLFQAFDTTPVLEEALAEAGYVPSEPTLVMATSLAGLSISEPTQQSVRVTEALGDVRTLMDDDDRLAEITATDQQQFWALASEGDLVLSCGMTIIDGDAAGIFAMRTRPDAWGRGAGRTVLAELLAACREQQVAEMWLQVEESNTRARGWYERLGFIKVTAYRYWRSTVTS